LETIIKCENVIKKFVNLLAVNNLSFHIERNTITSIIGPNGAGKSTTLNLITGVDRSTSGGIYFNGHDMSRIRNVDMAKQGISRTYQNVRLFHTNQMTVLDNVKVGMHSKYVTRFWASGLGLKNSKEKENEMSEKSEAILKFLKIENMKNKTITSLSFGNQRLVELARALAVEPTLLILDEPAAGLNDAETDHLANILIELKNRGITILLVEHHMGLVMKISQKVIVLNYGTKLAEGTPEEIKANDEVIKAYLGEETHDA
jgi:ABC-type branched-subunit amino acid transport system ATPase component